MAFDAQSSQFTAEFDATPSTRPTNSLVAFSDDTQNALTGFGTLVRFNHNGDIDARNDGAYAAASTIPYHARLTYHFRLDVDVVAHTYSISVQQGTGPVQVVGMNFAFRTQQNNVFNLDSLGALVDEPTGSLRVCNLAVTAQAPQVANPDCTLIMPNNPLTPAGLATPYVFTATDPDNGPCHELNADQSAFVQAGIFDPATGQISVYNPLVIDQGTAPAAPPVVPTLPPNAIVALWFGYNANNLTIQAPASVLTANNCHQGLAQFAYCNAGAFFRAANNAISTGQLVVPDLGIGSDGETCPSVRSFAHVDQDQSDNLTTTYLKTPGGLLAQNTAANLAALPGSTTFGNPSDNRLLDVFIDPALGCTPWTSPDITNPGHNSPSLPLNELQARAHQAAPVALIPAGDPFVLNPPLIGTPNDLARVNEYRRGVDQPVAASLADANTKTYCSNMRKIQINKMILDRPQLTVFRSPFPNIANSLFTFMAQRFVGSYELLNCADLLGQPDPVTLITDANGIVIDATFQP
ncbi:MAG: hypothetical protein DMG67_11775 [Acidobacteria bacterium]|nr:MAG: hypothetical protein DMG67_11775 [Acidobacteriota bacterium]